MGTKMIVGIVLIVLGIIGLAYQGFTWVSREPVATIGSVHIDADKSHTVWIGPTVGAAALAGGVALLLLGRKSA